MLRIFVLVVATASAFISASPIVYRIRDYVRQAHVVFIQDRIDGELKILGDQLLPEIGCINFGFSDRFSDKYGWNDYLQGALKATPENKNATLTCFDEWYVEGELVSDGFLIHVRRPECVFTGNYLLEAEYLESEFDLDVDFYRTFPAKIFTVEISLQKKGNGLVMKNLGVVEESDLDSELLGLSATSKHDYDAQLLETIYYETGLSISNTVAFMTSLTNKFNRKVDNQIRRLNFMRWFLLDDYSDLIGQQKYVDRNELVRMKDWITEYPVTIHAEEDEGEDVECYRHEETNETTDDTTDGDTDDTIDDIITDNDTDTDVTTNDTNDTGNIDQIAN